MKKIAFMAVAGVVGLIILKFLSPPPGMEQWMILLGTGAAIAGAGLGILVHDVPAGWKAFVVLVALAVLVGAVFGYRSVVAGEPGSLAASFLLIWTAAIFLSIGFLIEFAGLKWT